MFTYIDPRIREQLIASGKLVSIDCQGNTVNPKETENSDERIISILGPVPLPIQLEGQQYNLPWYASVRHTELKKVNELADNLRNKKGPESFAVLADSMAVNSILVFGNPDEWKNPLVRIHSSCLTGDVFGSRRCDCGPQLSEAISNIYKDKGGGLLIYMSGHEGRGIGLWAKAATYILQDLGENTYQANRSLGLPDDSRDFGDAASLIKYFLGNGCFRLLTNNPKKVSDLNEAGINNIERIKHVCGVGDSNRDYLSAKRDWGHKLMDKDIT